MTPDDARVRLAAVLPVRSVDALGAGLDHHTFVVNGDLVARFGSGPDAAQNVTREAAILAALPEYATVSTPEPVLADPGLGLLVYHLLPGVPLLTRPERHQYSAELAAFLTGLHSASADRMADLAGTDHTAPHEWLTEVRDIAEQLPAYLRALTAGFLATAAPEPVSELVFSHNDLGAEHILVDGNTITGIIDWSDCAVADPAIDLGRLVRDLGLPALGTLCPGADDQTRQRAVFYARCATLEDLAFGLSTGRDDYLRNARRALGSLFGGEGAKAPA